MKSTNAIDFVKLYLKKLVGCRETCNPLTLMPLLTTFKNELHAVS